MKRRLLSIDEAFALIPKMTKEDLEANQELLAIVLGLLIAEIESRPLRILYLVREEKAEGSVE